MNEALTAPTSVPTILCVDDEPNILSSLRRLFRGKDFEVRTAESGRAGLALLESQSADVVISDMRMPEMDGTQFLEQVRMRWPDTVRLLLTGQSDISSVIDAINRSEIHRYISKPWDDDEIVLTVRQALELKRLEQEKRRLELLTSQQNEQLRALNTSLEARVESRTAEIELANRTLQSLNEKLKASFFTMIKVFSGLIEMRGGNLAGHSRRVADLARRIALKLELDSKQVQQIFVAGLLHEVGKLGFTDQLLNTPVALMEPLQLETYRGHARRAEQLLFPLPDLRDTAEIISAQFERFDGTGFPEKRFEEAIPLGARILALASDYDNMQIGTITQRHLKPEEARGIITQNSGKRYDPRVVDAFVELLGGVPQVRVERQRPTDVATAVSDLQAGMVLSRDLISINGMLILSVAHTLDDRMISKLADFEMRDGAKLTPYVRLNLTTGQPVLLEPLTPE
ncbi:MAG: HD domain-containing phosphohydrolase [Comamonadaceae bacterium]